MNLICFLACSYGSIFVPNTWRNRANHSGCAGQGSARDGGLQVAVQIHRNYPHVKDMKAKDLKQLSQPELTARAAELRGHIRDLRFKVMTRQHAKVRDLRKAKQDLARCLTIMAQLKTQV